MARSGEAVAANTIPQNALRYILIGIGALLMAVFCAAVYNRIDHFLITDSRFILPPLPEGLWQSSTFRIEGAHFASVKQIADVF
ncbi:MAG TPA: hypothetical protein VE621_20400, partial [Bryobacteraceae bacterium]|nr:hypothetical protein [Bryobacteraceae bacterium]